MKKFLVLYRSTVGAREQMKNATPEQAKAGMDMWMQWAGKAGAAIVDLGSPVDGGATDIGGYSILQAESTTELDKVLDGHPHTMMPGNSIETLEFLALPGM